jgi:UV excision repair protein RAD23
MMQMVASMTPEQRTAMAQQMGVPAEQLAAMAAAMQGMGAPGGPAGGPGGAPPGTTLISLTAEEKAAVDRLTSMGFPKQRVLEAYLACDKNEEQAANLLMDSM